MNPALDYAENTLGVHHVYDEARGVEGDLDEAISNLDKAQDKRREVDQKIEDLQMNILIEERGKHGTMSEAAMTRHLKEVYHGHTELRALVQSRASYAAICSGIELDISYLKARVSILVARMNELGGYFQYLAAVKNAQTQEDLVRYDTALGQVMRDAAQAEQPTQPTQPTQPGVQQ